MVGKVELRSVLTAGQEAAEAGLCNLYELTLLSHVFNFAITSFVLGLNLRGKRTELLTLWFFLWTPERDIPPLSRMPCPLPKVSLIVSMLGVEFAGCHIH